MKDIQGLLQILVNRRLKGEGKKDVARSSKRKMSTSEEEEEEEADSEDERERAREERRQQRLRERKRARKGPPRIAGKISILNLCAANYTSTLLTKPLRY